MTNNTNTNNYELILKFKAKIQKISQGLNFNQTEAKLTRFLNKIKNYISSEMHDILFCINIRYIAKAM